VTFNTLKKPNAGLVEHPRQAIENSAGHLSVKEHEKILHTKQSETPNNPYDVLAEEEFKEDGSAGDDDTSQTTPVQENKQGNDQTTSMENDINIGDIEVSQREEETVQLSDADDIPKGGNTSTHTSKETSGKVAAAKKANDIRRAEIFKETIRNSELDAMEHRQALRQKDNMVNNANTLIPGANFIAGGTPPNPYIQRAKSTSTPQTGGILRKTNLISPDSSQAGGSSSRNINAHNKTGGLDKAILLKKGVLRSHIHRYNLWLSIKSCKSDEDEATIVHKSLQAFLEIMLQVDPKTIIPPYLFRTRRQEHTRSLSFLYGFSPRIYCYG
jgi:hypothetical protein